MKILGSFEQRVLSVLSDILNQPEAKLLSTPALEAHGWDSLNALNALLGLEAEFRVKLDLRKFYAAQRVDEILTLIAEASNETVPPTASTL